MSNEIFYGTEKSSTVTYLEFGEINLKEGKKQVWDFRLHQKAYDWLMTGRYSNDIIAYHSMMEKVESNSIQQIIDIHKSEIHHENEALLSLRKLIALIISREPDTLPAFFELGQTLFGCIEGMEFCQKILNKLGVSLPSIDLHEVNWYGVDISELFNGMSKLLHQNYSVYTDDNFDSLPETYDVFFSKGITLLYAVRTFDDLFDMLEKGKCSIFDYSFSLDGEQITTIGSGKAVKYLGYEEFLERYKKKSRKMYVRRDASCFNPETKRVFLDCIYAEEKICRDFIAKDIEINRAINELSRSIPELKILFLQPENETYAWLPVEEFVDNIAG